MILSRLGLVLVAGVEFVPAAGLKLDSSLGLDLKLAVELSLELELDLRS